MNERSEQNSENSTSVHPLVIWLAGAFIVIGLGIVVGARVHQFAYRPELTEAQALRAYGAWFALGIGIAWGAIWYLGKVKVRKFKSR